MGKHSWSALTSNPCVYDFSEVIYFFFYFYVMILIFFNIAGLQCSDNFLLYSKVTQSYAHIYIPFSHMIMLQFSVLHSSMSLLVHSRGKSLHLLTPDSQSIHSHPVSLGNRQSVLQVHDFFSVESSFVPYTRFQI